MKFKLDENLGSLGVAPLTAAGHDVTTAFEQALCGADDSQVIAVCRREGRCLVTLDTDFADIITYPPQRYAGIAVLRLPPRYGLREVQRALGVLVTALQASDIRHKLWIVEMHRVRERDDDG